MSDAKMERLSARKQDLEEKVAKNPGSRGFWIQLGNVCKELGDDNRAIEAYKKALELDSNDSFTQNVLNSLEGRGVQRPPLTRKPVEYRKPTPSAPPSGRRPGEWPKWSLPAGIALLLALAGGTYKCVTSMSKPKVYQIAELDRNLLHPKFSPDGAWIAFVAQPTDENPRVDTTMYIATPDAKTLKAVYTETKGASISVSEPTWLPDSSGFIIQIRNGKKGPAYLFVRPNGESEILDLDVKPSYNSRPAISPDGNRIVYKSKDEETRDDILVAADISIGGGSEIARYDNIHGVAWSPDGSVIAYCASSYEEGGSKTYLFTVGADGSNLNKASEADYGCEPAFFGAEDTRLLFYKNRNLYITSMDASLPPEKFLPISFDDRVGGDLAVSSDLTTLAFVAVVGATNGPQGVGGGYTVGNVFLLGEGESEPVPAIEGYRGKFSPTLSPDGMMMAFEKFGRTHAGALQIWVGETALKK